MGSLAIVGSLTSVVAGDLDCGCNCRRNYLCLYLTAKTACMIDRAKVPKQLCPQASKIQVAGASMQTCGSASGKPLLPLNRGRRPTSRKSGHAADFDPGSLEESPALEATQDVVARKVPGVGSSRALR